MGIHEKVTCFAQAAPPCMLENMASRSQSYSHGGLTLDKSELGATSPFHHHTHASVVSGPAVVMAPHSAACHQLTHGSAQGPQDSGDCCVPKGA